MLANLTGNSFLRKMKEALSLAFLPVNQTRKEKRKD